MLFATCGMASFIGFRLKYREKTEDVRFGEATLVKKILAMQHRLNPLHVYCRFLDRGMSKRLSTSICKVYETVIFSWISLFIKTMIHLFCFVKRDFRIQEEVRKG